MTGVEPNSLMLSYKPRTLLTTFNAKAQENPGIYRNEVVKIERPSFIKGERVWYYNKQLRKWAKATIINQHSRVTWILEIGGARRLIHRDEIKKYHNTYVVPMDVPSTSRDMPVVTLQSPGTLSSEVEERSDYESCGEEFDEDVDSETPSLSEDSPDYQPPARRSTRRRNHIDYKSQMKSR